MKPETPPMPDKSPARSRNLRLTDAVWADLDMKVGI